MLDSLRYTNGLVLHVTRPLNQADARSNSHINGSLTSYCGQNCALRDCLNAHSPYSILLSLQKPQTY